MDSDLYAAKVHAEREKAEIVRAAEKGIAKILAEVEEATGSLVECVDLESIEVTTMCDVRERHKMRVDISLRRQPGRDWG